jgi:hypothetical protein
MYFDHIHPSISSFLFLFSSPHFFSILLDFVMTFSFFFFQCFLFFWDRVSWTICLGWFWTTILPNPASWVARFTGVSHWCPPCYDFFKCVYNVLWSYSSSITLSSPTPAGSSFYIHVLLKVFWNLDSAWKRDAYLSEFGLLHLTW